MPVVFTLVHLFLRQWELIHQVLLIYFQLSKNILCSSSLKGYSWHLYLVTNEVETKDLYLNQSVVNDYGTSKGLFLVFYICVRMSWYWFSTTIMYLLVRQWKCNISSTSFLLRRFTSVYRLRLVVSIFYFRSFTYSVVIFKSYYI